MEGLELSDQLLALSLPCLHAWTFALLSLSEAVFSFVTHDPAGKHGS